MPRVDSTTEPGKRDKLASPRDAGVAYSRTSIGKSLVLEEYVNSTLTSGHPHFSSGTVQYPSFRKDRGPCFFESFLAPD
jgi:hypothetical protein